MPLWLHSSRCRTWQTPAQLKPARLGRIAGLRAHLSRYGDLNELEVVGCGDFLMRQAARNHHAVADAELFVAPSLNDAFRHSTPIDMSSYSAETGVPSFQSRTTCVGKRVRPNWKPAGCNATR